MWVMLSIFGLLRYGKLDLRAMIKHQRRQIQRRRGVIDSNHNRVTNQLRHLNANRNVQSFNQLSNPNTNSVSHTTQLATPNITMQYTPGTESVNINIDSIVDSRLQSTNTESQ